jgi:hypothetical protein
MKVDGTFDNTPSGTLHDGTFVLESDVVSNGTFADVALTLDEVVW